MKRQKKRRRFQTSTSWNIPQSQTIEEMEPEKLAAYVRRAEKEVLPIIMDMQLSPAGAEFLLAQRTKAQVTGDPRLIPELAMLLANTVLALWQAGIYTPSPKYPYTFEETLQEIQEDVQGWAVYFQPFIVAQEQALRGLGQGAEGIFMPPEIRP